MSDTKVQWHPGFVAAMHLELAGNRADLVFEKEHNLNTKPLAVDLLVVKKDPSAHISNEIGALFRGHNIVEYKSPEDHLDIDAFYKAGAYACLYKSYGETVDAVGADDVTVSILREARPDGLFRYFAGHGYLVSSPYRGIYYIEGNVLFPTQIIVTGELEPGNHVWLRALSGNLQKDDIRGLLADVNGLTEKQDREFADSVLEVSIGANRQTVEELRGEDSMCHALMEIMEPLVEEEIQRRMEKRVEEEVQERVEKRVEEEVQERVEKRVEEEVQERVEKRVEEEVQEKVEQVKKELKEVKEELKRGIQAAIDTLREFGHGDAEIKPAIMRQYHISAEEVEGYL